MNQHSPFLVKTPYKSVNGMDRAILITPPRKQTSNHAISTWTAGAASLGHRLFTITAGK
jgi:hypothetical protein